jgi:hypothetical protein
MTEQGCEHILHIAGVRSGGEDAVKRLQHVLKLTAASLSWVGSSVNTELSLGTSERT